MVDALVLGTSAREGVRVRVPPPLHHQNKRRRKMIEEDYFDISMTLADVIDKQIHRREISYFSQYFGLAQVSLYDIIYKDKLPLNTQNTIIFDEEREVDVISVADGRAATVKCSGNDILEFSFNSAFVVYQMLLMLCGGRERADKEAKSLSMNGVAIRESDKSIIVTYKKNGLNTSLEGKRL